MKAFFEKYRILIAPIIIFFIAVPIGVGVGFLNTSIARKAFVEDWDYGKYAIGKCTMTSLPVITRNCLGSEVSKADCTTDKELDAAYNQAHEIWRKGLGDVLYGRSLRDYQPDKDRNRSYIPIFQHRKLRAMDDHPCATLPRGIDSELGNNRFGSTVFPNSPGYPHTFIFICADKFKEVSTYKKSKSGYWARRIRLAGVIAHEIGHLLVGPNHPDPHARLMSATPSSASISPTTVEIVKQSAEKCGKER